MRFVYLSSRNKKVMPFLFLILAFISGCSFLTSETVRIRFYEPYAWSAEERTVAENAVSAWAKNQESESARFTFGGSQLLLKITDKTFRFSRWTNAGIEWNWTIIDRRTLKKCPLSRVNVLWEESRNKLPFGWTSVTEGNSVIVAGKNGEPFVLQVRSHDLALYSFKQDGNVQMIGTFERPSEGFMTGLWSDFYFDFYDYGSGYVGCMGVTKDLIPLRGNPIIGHRKTDFLFIDLTSMCSFNFAPEEDASPFDFRRLDGIAIHKGRYLLYCNDREYSFPICEKRRPLKRLSK